MPLKDNLSAYVRVDGSCLPEYNVEVIDDEQTVACWIPSEAGKMFDLCIHNTSRTHTVAVLTWVDGIKSPEGKLIRAETKSSDAQEIGPKCPCLNVNGFPKSTSSFQPFVFSPCILLEGDDGGQLISKAMGQIELAVWEVIEGGIVPRVLTQATIPPLHISERAKKGIVHGIQLGEEKAMPKNDSWQKVKYVRQVVKFVFRYRPIDVLRANEIAPFEPKTQLAQGKEDIIDLTLEDEEEQEDEQDKRIRELQEQLEALKRQRKDKKRKRSASDTGIKHEVKVEIDLS